ncbi:MAG: AAA family ATPase [Anaerolineales bacterium]|nr:AAA family ATPase [Anaerolineales bacterium]
MAIVAVIGSKGGVGTSLIATNLGCSLAGPGSSLLVDLHAGNGVDDLLLDSSAEKTWLELFPVLNELQSKHVDLATSTHSSGLKLMRGPEGWNPVAGSEDARKLIRALDDLFDWCLIDLPPGLSLANQALLAISDAILLVTSADPPALRGALRFATALPSGSADRVGLVVDQINRQHPSTASQIAESLGMPLLAALPPDPRAVGYQIHFGRACVLDRASPFGRGIRALAGRLQKSAGGQIRARISADAGGVGS